MSVRDLEQVTRLLAQLDDVLPAARRAALRRAVGPLVAAYRRSGCRDAAVLAKIVALLRRYPAAKARLPKAWIAKVTPSPRRVQGGPAKGKVRRTTLRSTKGERLYAVRDSKGRIKDIEAYRRGHASDMVRKAKKASGPKPHRPRIRRAAKKLGGGGGSFKAKARRTTVNSFEGTKLNAVRDSKRRLQDILTYQRKLATALRHRSVAAAKLRTGRSTVRRAAKKKGGGGGGRRSPTAAVARPHTTSPRRRTPRVTREPRWIQARVMDLAAADGGKPTPAFRADGQHEVQVVIAADRQDWLVARGRDASESIDSRLPRGTYKLTVVFFVPASGVHQTGTLTLPPDGPTPEPAMFRFQAGQVGTVIEALISIVHRGRVLQTALLSGTSVMEPALAPKEAQITLRLQVVVPALAELGRREAFDAALVTATGTDKTAVAAGVVHRKRGAGKTVCFTQPRINEAARSIRDVLEEVVADDSVKGKLDSEAARALLWKLAQKGRILYEQIGERLENELAGQDLSRLQLVQADPGAFIPIEFTYGLPPPANGAGLCNNWKAALAGRPCTARHHKTNALGHLEVVCPSGFWSVSKVIERQILKDIAVEEMQTSDFAVRAEPTTQRPTLPPVGNALFAWSEILDNIQPGTSTGVLESLKTATGKHAAKAKTWLKWAEAIDTQRPGLLVLLSHTVDDSLEIGAENSGERATVAQINSKFVKKLAQDAPIVFLLGCTTGVAEDTLVSFVGRFRDQGAALVVGTITPVLGERSAEVVRAVVERVTQKREKPVRFGDLMRDARRDLLSRGELTALCAASFGDASWYVS